jgi:gamma-glutamyltranspeptidase/glutathione hydrolase
MWKNTNLANTLERIGDEGPETFYKGDMALTIAHYMNENGGFLDLKDLADHRSEWVEPRSVDYRGFDVWELPPNGQGMVALQMLRLMEPYDVSAMGFGSADHLHLFTEAKKIAYEDRACFYADPDFSNIPMEGLLSRDYATLRGKLLNMSRAARHYPHGEPPVLDKGDTVYMTAADCDGNMVSLIQSNYHGMGSGMTPPGLGFVLQNRGELFSLEAGHANVFAPGKRPFHTIIPAFITRDGKPWISFGVMGGGMQPQGHVQIVSNLVDFGMNLQEAGDAPRIRHFGSSEPTGGVMRDGGTISLEPGFDVAAVRELERRGHKLKSSPGSFGGYQAIMRDTDRGVYRGASECRKDGQAAGY